jgi:hypothetical protein
VILTRRQVAASSFVRKKLRQRLKQGRSTAGQPTEERAQREGWIALSGGELMHAGKPGQLGFKMPDGAEARIFPVEETKGPSQQLKQLRRRVFRLGAYLNQLDKV